MGKLNKDKRQEEQLKYENGCANIVDVLVLVILCIFPLVYHDYYFDILETKYLFFCASILIAAITSFIYSLYKKKISFDFKKIQNSLSVPDYALIAFLVIAGISTLLSEYRFESFWGNEGRYTGLFLLILYGLTYFMITRYYKFKRWHLDAFLFSGLLASLFGITDYFQLDILDFKVDMKESQYNMFSSTIGNINTYTAYIALLVAIAAILFAVSKEWKKTIWYYVCLVISMAALIMGSSDNAYLALAALFGLTPLYLFSSRKGIRNYLIIVASFFSIVKMIDLINEKYSEKVLGIESLFNTIAGFDKLLYLIVALWGLVILVAALDYIYGDKGQRIHVGVRYIWLAFICIVFGAIVYVFYDANIAGNGERYGSLQQYLVITDSWGTTRGYIWRIAMENFNKFTPLQKIFGFGPDTFGIVTVNNNYNEMINVYNVIFDSAHNEYLQYLITIGIAGLTAYVVLLVTAFYRIIRRAGKNPCAMAILFSLLCYGAQALVNINLPITTPIMWVLMMMGLSICYQNSRSESVKVV